MGVTEGAATLPTDGTTIAAGIADSAGLWWALTSGERVGATNDGKLLLAKSSYAWDGTVWRRILIDTSGRIIAVGGAAHDAAAAGNPLRVAGVYRATPAAVADGDVVDLFTDAAGRPQVDIARIAATAAPTPRTPAAGAALVSALPVEAIPMLGNSSTYDPEQGNSSKITVIASAARTAGLTSADQTNYNARGMLLVLRITSASGAGGIQFRVFYNDSAAQLGLFNAPMPSTAITATGRYGVLIYPGLAQNTLPTTLASGDFLAAYTLNFALPRTWRVATTHGNADSYTYQMECWYIL